MSARDEELGRRELLRRGAALGATLLGLDSAAAHAADEPPRVRRYRVLGKTGLEVPDIGFGSSAMAAPKLVAHALERGITYFDTADSYPMKRPGLAEVAIGRAVAGRRDEVVIATKTQTTSRMTRDKMMRRLEASLRRLQTDRVDIYFNHAVNDPGRLENPEWFEFAEAAKRQGKIRFTGMSGHGGRLIECLDKAIDEGLVDVILAAHNFGSDPAFYERFTKGFDVVANQKGLPRVLAKAREKGIGVVVMKTLMGARLNDMRPYEWGGATTAQAAFRWVFSQPDVDALIVSMRTPDQIDEYLGASGETRVRTSDARLLRGYLAANAATQCRSGCGACATACPEGVPISDVLRARMYQRDYRQPEQGRATYASLDIDAAACAGCTHRACVDSCIHGLRIPDLTRDAHEVLAAG